MLRANYSVESAETDPLPTEVVRCTDEIVRYPEAGPVIRGSIRRRLIRRFPYALLYRVRATEVRILAVMNLKRRPAYWVDRA